MTNFFWANPFVFLVGCMQLAGGIYSYKVNGDYSFGVLWCIYAVSCFWLTWVEYIKMGR